MGLPTAPGNVASELSANVCDPPCSLGCALRDSVPWFEELTLTWRLEPAAHPDALLQVALPAVELHVSPPVAGAHPVSVAPEGDVTVSAMVPFCSSVPVRLTVHVLLLGTGAGLLQVPFGAVSGGAKLVRLLSA